MTIDEIKTLIASDELRTLEMKKTTGELKDGMHSLCAMLNSDGGYVIFGIAPKSLKIIGQMVTDNTRQEIGREIRKLEPAINMAVDYIDVPDSDGLKLIVLHADKNLYSAILSELRSWKFRQNLGFGRFVWIWTLWIQTEIKKQQFCLTFDL